MSVDLIATRLERLSRVRAAMDFVGVEACLFSLGADLPWCSGYEAMPLERPTVLVVPEDEEATLFVPMLEAPRVSYDERLFRIRPWGETEDPAALVASCVGTRRSLAISDRAHASLLLSLQNALSSATWRPASSITGPIRARKDAAELDALRGAARAADVVATALLSSEIALIGRSEKDVASEITSRLIAEGHAKVNFAIVASGPNAASPHHEASDRVIGERETVVCDFGGTFHLDGDIGYCSDTTRTVVTGAPPPEVDLAYRALQEAQEKAVMAVAPGVTCEQIDRIGRDIITTAGFGQCFIHRIGHGIGVEEHEDPYLVEGNATPLVSGNAFSIEPGIYLPGHFGMRIEDIVCVTSSGVERLNDTDHDLAVIEA